MEHIETIRLEPDSSTTDKSGGVLHVETFRDGPVMFIVDGEGTSDPKITTFVMTTTEAQKLIAALERALFKE